MARMGPVHLVARSLSYYWRTNIAVVIGVAAAVTVLAGALLVGDSVRGSLRDLVVQRLGNTELMLASSDFFRAQLVDDLLADPSFGTAFDGVAPIIAVQGLAIDQATGRRASRVLVYGIDDRFWRFHGRPALVAEGGGGSRDAWISPALARETGTAAGATLLLRVERPSSIPLESLHSRKDDPGRTLRVTVRAVLEPDALGEFSLQPQQGDVRAAFVPLSRLQEDLGMPDRVNALLVSARPGSEADPSQFESLVRRHARIEDIGLKVRVLDGQHMLSLESDAGLIDDARAEAARGAGERAGLRPEPVLTYLVNTIRRGEREIPYSLVTAVALDTIAQDARTGEPGVLPIVLNEWAARDLSAKVGDMITLEYYVWEDPGRLVTASQTLQLAGIVPLRDAAADRDLAPAYPGITESETLRDWNPPFPIDLGRIRPIDEQYWQQHRTTPKAFVPLDVGRTLWRSRYGALTSIRFTPPPGVTLIEAREQLTSGLRAAVDPLTAGGLSVRPVRAEGLAASGGATNFGEYFTYFSFFLVVSALMLASLFFKLGVEQRVREVGLLRAVGFTTRSVRRLFAAEALLLSMTGSAIGVVGAIGYGSLMMTGLRTWWVDAVGTTALRLHVAASSLLTGAAAGIVAAVVCIWWTLATLARVSERSLLVGQMTPNRRTAAARPAKTGRHLAALRWPGPLTMALACVLLGAALIALALAGWIDRTGAFFGAGASLLAGCLSALTAWLRRPPRRVLMGHGWWPVSRLGLRNAKYHPARGVLAVAVMASATFILISVEAFRRNDVATSTDPRSGTGGYALLVETLMPVVHDPNSKEGRELLGLSSLEDVGITRFRVRPGDDASCLNLYAPRQPRIVGATREFIAEGRFAFQGSLGRSDQERENPWLLLLGEEGDESIPVVADANSMTYVLHRALGDEIVVDGGNGRPLRLRLVAALADSVLQGELVMSEANFLRAFPEQEGYRLLLVTTPPDRADLVAAAIEDRLADFGADAVPTAQRLAEFHQVENTYLSTFQTLGGLGLLLGTVGLAAVLLRNVLERRQELALLGAVGYGQRHLFTIVIAESALLLTCGLAVGTVCALVAITPAALDRGGALPTGSGAWLLMLAVFGTGLVSSVVATRAAIRAPLIEALRAD